MDIDTALLLTEQFQTRLMRITGTKWWLGVFKNKNRL